MIRHQDFEDFKFTWDKSTDEGLTCHCTIKRKGREPFVASYSQNDAAKAGLDKKLNWTNYLKQMLMRRAINMAFHYVFPDALFTGLVVANTPYESDPINSETLVANESLINSVSETLVANKSLSSTSETDDIEVIPDVSSEELVLPNTEDTNYPKTQQLLNKDLPSIKDVKTAFKFDNKGGNRAGRESVIEFYEQVINNECSEQNDAMLAILLMLLEHYVNSKNVSSKIIDAVNNNNGGQKKYTPITLNSDAILKFLSISTIKKMIVRLIDWASKRISICEEICRFAITTGYPEIYLIGKSTYFESEGYNEYSSMEFKMGFSIEYQNTVSRITRADDYREIPLEYMEDTKNRIELEIETALSNKDKFISHNECVFIKELISKSGFQELVVLHPFTDYPDAILIKDGEVENVIKFCHYLETQASESAEYPTTEEAMLIMERCVVQKINSFAVSEEVCGVRKIDIHSIPLSILKDSKLLA